MPKFNLPQFKKLPVHEIALVFLVVFVALLGTYVISITPVSPTANVSLSITQEKNPFKDLDLSAQAAYVWDAKKQKALFAYNANTSLPLASLTKVMMAVTAVDLIPPYTTIVIEPEHLKEEGDSGLYGNERWKLKDLLDYSLVVSSNDGARAIASVAGSIYLGTSTQSLGREGFVSKMNEKAEMWNLRQTHFINENGLDIDEENGGAYGSARDMAILFEYVLNEYPLVIEMTREKEVAIESLSHIVHRGENTNTKVSEIPGLLASKTGFTDLSGGNLVIAFSPDLNHPIIISVLGSTYEGRFNDVLTLVQATQLYLKEK
ncbi:MAG: D-alanyl-D-alanine carboxypeptidase [Candidatus Pacebacteria bacterium]|nr:D-alanyl-D-alanine carboxypeptidase [Candidatus Paceibacterota bacterium]